MNQKIGRNDPCPCGSGKKYKNCCFLKSTPKKQKITAKWLNAPQGPNLMERAYGNAIASTGKVFTPLQSSEDVSAPSEKHESNKIEENPS